MPFFFNRESTVSPQTAAYYHYYSYKGQIIGSKILVGLRCRISQLKFPKPVKPSSKHRRTEVRTDFCKIINIMRRFLLPINIGFWYQIFTLLFYLTSNLRSHGSSEDCVIPTKVVQVTQRSLSTLNGTRCFTTP